MNVAEINSFREVLPEQGIRVFIGVALPGAAPPDYFKTAYQAAFA